MAPPMSAFTDSVVKEIEQLHELAEISPGKKDRAIAYAREHAHKWENSAMSVSEATDCALGCV